VIYLDHASAGLPSPTALSLAAAELEWLRRPRATAGSEVSLRAIERHEGARTAAARFARVPSERIALISNTTYGLGLIAAGLELPPRANVVLPAADFLSLATVWRPHVEQGLELRTVHADGGRLTPGCFARAMDERTAVIATSAVQEVSGERIALAELGRLANDADALLIVDGIQEAGALRRDLRDAPIDAYVTGGHKWLRNPFAMGYMVLGPRLLERCRTLAPGYLGLEPPAPGWDAWLAQRERTVLDHPPARQGAPGLELGGVPNGIAAAGLEGALSDAEATDLAETERRVLELGARLREALPAGARALGPPERAARSGITTITLRGGLDSERELLQRLRAEGVLAALRSAAGEGGVRIAAHATNTEPDIDATVAIVAAHLSD
jgi:cysteine desulfurase / selenocysteine lyase